MADEPRRVRTQAERDADGTVWWWRGYDGQWQPGPAPHVAQWLRQSAANPPFNRVDDIERLRARIQGNPAGLLLGVTEPPPPDPDIWVTTESVNARPLRRRWWHRLTRREL